MLDETITYTNWLGTSTIKYRERPHTMLADVDTYRLDGTVSSTVMTVQDARDDCRWNVALGGWRRV